MSWRPFLPDPRYSRPRRDVSSATADRESLALAFVGLAYVATTAGFDDPARAVAWLGLGAVILGAAASRDVWAGWLIVLAGLILGIAWRPLAVANHHYVLAWASLAMVLALSADPEAREGLVRHNARWMMVAMMAFATLHKLISPAFMDGSFLAFGITAGSFGEPLFGLCASCAEAIDQNLDALGAFRATLPEPGSVVRLIDPIPNVPRAAGIFAAAILLVEAGIFAMFLLAPNRRASHLLVLAFAIGLGVIRQELAFISIVVVLGYLGCPRGHRWLKRAYLLAAIVFSGLSVY